MVDHRPRSVAHCSDGRESAALHAALAIRTRRSIMNETKLHELAGKAVTEWSVAESAPLVYLGDKLGLYRAMAGAGPLTSQELADRTGTHERYVRERVHNHAPRGGAEPHAPLG